ncbi:DUF3617 family protein [Sphingomonas sp. TREG-RG-20F-R18-01]|uniref:DUF3617 domain-containing protein n=1 Tax=Sphingomonas sp. TREG-RG-20F-R18-01 TaxID=2914982 RepID=UPI001F59034C|nr:DUF3617 family protein [Sphingomonas sp. TREG-RG-20F-R18-01]
MWKSLLLLGLVVPGISSAQSIAPGRWDVVSTATDLDIPGAPGFLLRMMKGRSKAEHKCVSAEQAKAGVAALLAPDPKAHCHVDSVQIDKGRFTQVLSCPQKQGAPLKVSRSGTYDLAGFAGQAQMSGVTPKGAMRIRLEQRAAHLAGACRG